MTRFPRLSEKQFTILDTLVRESQPLSGIELVRKSKNHIKRGTVFTTLSRLAERGYVTSRGGPSNPEYEPTVHGVRVYEAFRMVVGKPYEEDTRSAAIAGRFALTHDDGDREEDYGQADLIIVGVSRVGKTPLSLYLGFMFGIKVANFPLIEEDLVAIQSRMPTSLAPHRAKLIGLSTGPSHLHSQRKARYPDSKYASMRTCRGELNASEEFFRRERIIFFNSSEQAIEELGSRIGKLTGHKRIIWR